MALKETTPAQVDISLSQGVKIVWNDGTFPNSCARSFNGFHCAAWTPPRILTVWIRPFA